MKRANQKTIIIAIDWDSIQNKPESFDATFEGLDTLGDVGTGANQLAIGNHTHGLLYAPLAHNHIISEVTGLQGALDGKAATHSHPYAPDSHITEHPAPTVRDARNQVAGNYAPTHTHPYIGDAPSDGKQYARINAAWAELVASGGGASVAIDDTAPTGDESLWYQPSKGIFNILIDGQWVEATRKGLDGTDGTDGTNGVDGASGSPTGTISMWGATAPPTDHLICNGTAISRTTYSVLFAVLGTIYGVGDGSTTFNLPNLKGNVAVGLDSAQTEFDALGKTGGAKTHQLTVDEMPSHSHRVYVDNDTTPDGGSGGIGGEDIAQDILMADNGAIVSTGGDVAHNNIQPYITLNYIIKT